MKGNLLMMKNLDKVFMLKKKKKLFFKNKVHMSLLMVINTKDSGKV